MAMFSINSKIVNAPVRSLFIRHVLSTGSEGRKNIYDAWTNKRLPHALQWNTFVDVVIVLIIQPYRISFQWRKLHLHMNNNSCPTAKFNVNFIVLNMEFNVQIKMQPN